MYESGKIFNFYWVGENVRWRTFKMLLLSTLKNFLNFFRLFLEFTERKLKPEEDGLLLNYKIGLINIRTKFTQKNLVIIFLIFIFDL